MEDKNNPDIFPIIKKSEKIDFDVELKPVKPMKQPTLTDEELFSKIFKIMEEENKEYCRIIQEFIYNRDICKSCVYHCIHNKREIMDGLKR